MRKVFLTFGLCAVLLSACSAPTQHSGPLEQSPPRPVAGSHQLPAEARLGPVIAGLEQGAVPQGLTALTDRNIVVTSHYSDADGPSVVVLTDWASGRSLATFELLEPGGEAHNGHVGGIAADREGLWVASDAYLYRGDIEQLRRQSGGEFRMQQRFATEATYEVAFCSVYDDQVWAGEFALDDKYPTDPAHHLTARDGNARRGWISAYDPAQGFEHPQRVLSIPDRAQGMFATDEYIYLSISYGRRYRSSLEIHRNPLSEPPHRMVETSKGQEVPLWFIDGENHLRSIDLPPMSQNIIIVDDQVAVLFESGASKFRWFGKKPLDQIVLLPAISEP